MSGTVQPRSGVNVISGLPPSLSSFVSLAPKSALGRLFLGVAPSTSNLIPLQPLNWQPHPQRGIRLFEIVTRAPRPRPATFLPLRWPDKPQAAILDFSIDARGLLSCAGDQLMITVENSASLTVAATAIVGHHAVLWLGGGSPGSDNVVFITLSTASGRTVNRTVRLAVI